MTIRCIAFDLDDTLWDCKPVIARAEQRFYAWLQTHYPHITERHSPHELVQKRINNMQQYPELHYNLAICAKSADHAGGGMITRQHWWNPVLRYSGWRERSDFFAGTLEVLEALSLRFLLGAITTAMPASSILGWDICSSLYTVLLKPGLPNHIRPFCRHWPRQHTPGTGCLRG